MKQNNYKPTKQIHPHRCIDKWTLNAGCWMFYDGPDQGHKPSCINQIIKFYTRYKCYWTSDFSQACPAPSALEVRRVVPGTLLENNIMPQIMK